MAYDESKSHDWNTNAKLAEVCSLWVFAAVPHRCAASRILTPWPSADSHLRYTSKTICILDPKSICIENLQNDNKCLEKNEISIPIS